MLEAVFVRECETPTLKVMMYSMSKPGLISISAGSFGTTGPPPPATPGSRPFGRSRDCFACDDARCRPAAPLLQRGLRIAVPTFQRRRKAETESQRQSTRITSKAGPEHSQPMFSLRGKFSETAAATDFTPTMQTALLDLRRQRKKHAFRKQLPHQTRGIRSKRRANSKLPCHAPPPAQTGD